MANRYCIIAPLAIQSRTVATSAGDSCTPPTMGIRCPQSAPIARHSGSMSIVPSILFIKKLRPGLPGVTSGTATCIDITPTKFVRLIDALKIGNRPIGLL